MREGGATLQKIDFNRGWLCGQMKPGEARSI